MIEKSIITKDIEKCSQKIIELMSTLGRPIDEDTLIAILNLYYPMYDRRTIHMSIINLEENKIIKSIYRTEFILRDL